MNASERRALRDRCRWLVGPGPRTPAAMLAEVATYCAEHDIRFDGYGEGQFIEAFEARVAEMLGFEAARFMPSGTMAQVIALRLWCDEAELPCFGMHPTSHLELHEQHAYQHLHGLQATLIGPADGPLLAEHLEASERLAVLLTELPVREAGGVLPSFEELAALKTLARERGIKLHLDGARLWECAPFYGRAYETICEGFDSAYVSFYKGIGALPGAMLLGSRTLIDEAAIWQRRHGGNLYTLTPNAASAAMLLDERIAKMPAYYARACTVADVLRGLPGIELKPDPPHTNMMHVTLPVDVETALQTRDDFAKRTGVWLFGGATEAGDGCCKVELYLGEGAQTVTDDEVARGFAEIVERRA